MSNRWVLFVMLLVSAICQAEDVTFVANQGGQNHINVISDIFGNPEFRQALSTSYDTENAGSIGTINHPHLPQSWAYNPNGEHQPYDIEYAKLLLEDAGWVDEDGDGIRECTGCKYTEPHTFDVSQDENRSGFVFSLNNDLIYKGVNANTGNPIGPKIVLFNSPPGVQLVTACLDNDYFAGVLYGDRYFLFFNSLENGRPDGDPVFYSLGTPIISLDCGEIQDDGTFPMVGIELQTLNGTQQTRPFIVNWNEDFTVDKPSKPLAPWTKTNPQIAYEQRFNTVTFLPVILKSDESSLSAATFPIGIIYGKPGPNTLTPFFQAINPNGSKRGGPKKLPLPTGIWRSYAAIKPFTNTAARKKESFSSSKD